MSEPIICSGNDLASVCADIRARGGVFESLDAGGALGNAGYKVSYFEARSDNGHVAELEDASVAGGDRSRKLPSLAIEGSIPSVLINFGNGVPVRRGEDQGEKKTCSNHPAEPETSPDSPAIVISIEDRMAALQERLAASGKLGASRFKSTKEARLPHPND